jgi:hypothetical protein
MHRAASSEASITFAPLARNDSTPVRSGSVRAPDTPCTPTPSPDRRHVQRRRNPRRIGTRSVPSPPPTRLPTRSLRSSSPESPASRPSPIRTRSRRSIPALLPSPPPTQLPARRSSSPESPAGRRLASASRSRFRFVYVDVPPRSRKRALSPDDASSDIADSARGDPKDLTLNKRHPEFLHNAKKFLLNVSESRNWRVLLLRYAEFEGLAVRCRFSHTFHSNLTRFSGLWETFNFFAS